MMVTAVSQFHAPSNQPHPWLGRLLGDHNRYRLDQQLGSGGMGEVFSATDTRLGKSVAIKVLRESLAIANDLDLKERFERECAICAALKSSHIVQVSDYGVTSEGYPFYVMEYLQGQTLEQRLMAQPRLDIAQTCNIITQVCAGLQMAHEGVMIWNREENSSKRIKVIHRDLKPANIFLVSTALGELVKVIDFGIAKIHSLQAEYTSATNMFLGTCHYAPPEQFDGGKDIDERSDIYSLGIILYEMLTGTDPFGFDFRKKRITNSAWLAAHASKSPKPMRSQPHCEHIPFELEAVVMQCLQKSPGDRFASVASLRKALQSANSDSSTFIRLPAADTEETLVEKKSTVPTVVEGLSRGDRISNAENQPKRKFSRLLAGGSALLVLAFGIYSVPRLEQFSTLARTDLGTTLVNGTHQLALAETLSGNSNPVLAAVLSPDGQTLISGGEDRDAVGQFYPIKLWDLKTGQVLRTLDGHLQTVRSLSLSEDGRTLASGSGDNTIKIWDVTTGNLLQTLEGHTAPVSSVALSQDGQTLISGSEDKTVIIWNLETGASQVLSGHSATVYSVALDRDGRTIASSSEDKTIKLWDLETGELIRTLGEPGGHKDVVSAVAFSANGQQLASASWDGSVKLWNAATGQLLQTFQGHSDRVTTVTFIDEQAIASASLDNTIKIWNAQTGQSLQNIAAHSDWILSVTAQPSAQTLVSSSTDTTIKIWR
jgi:eukaryotic-like serine/threonine-protein kinase